MQAFLTFFLVIAMLGVLAVLGLGVMQMIRGGDPRKSNKLMQSRVLLQGIALLIFAIIMMFLRH
ncbi:MAG: twin transmembrane helix small protein [Alphaproteobacteria bacterium]|nr:twin transmembrane helix small protein [Alphaproteobacteria bacterium]